MWYEMEILVKMYLSLNHYAVSKRKRDRVLLIITLLRHYNVMGF